MAGVHEDWMERLSDQGLLDREIEFLPTTEEMEARRRSRKGLTAPELAVLMAYTKIVLEDEILASDLPDDPYLADRLINYFPSQLRERYADRMPEHRLHREIITTVVVNRFVNSSGITCFHRLSSETGAEAAGRDPGPDRGPGDLRRPMRWIRRSGRWTTRSTRRPRPCCGWRCAP